MIIIFDENFISQDKIFSYLTGRIEKLNIKLLIGKQEYRDNITVKKFKRMTKSIGSKAPEIMDDKRTSEL